MIIENKEEDYWECKSCNINSLTKNRIIPCPRGGCEAEVKGTLTTVVTLEKIKEKSFASRAIKMAQEEVRKQNSI